MRHRKYSKDQAKRMGKRSQELQENNRLAHAVNLRQLNSFLVFEVRTNNPSTGTQNHIEIRHEIDNGNNRYNIYLNGEMWRSKWSRTRFVNWLFNQIDSVIIDMEY